MPGAPITTRAPVTGARISHWAASKLIGVDRERQHELTEGGRGLLIVAAVTDRWGWHALPDNPAHPGKTVWFECATKPTDNRPT